MIFYDPTARRRRLLRRIGLVFTLLFAGTTTLFVLSLLLVPVVPHLSPHKPHRLWHTPVFHLPNRQSRLSRHIFIQARTALFQEVAADERRVHQRAGIVPPSPIVAAFYTTWQETGLHSLRANADKLTHLLPEWLHLNPQGNGIDWYDWDPAAVPHNRDVLQIARRHGLQVLPVLNNAQEGRFDPERAHKLLHDPLAQQALAEQLRSWLIQQGFQGVNVDFENLYPQDYPFYARWLEQLRRYLHTAGLQVSADIEAGVDGRIWREIAKACDWVVLMAYDEHYAGGPPGPIAELSWARQVLVQAVRAIPPEKLVLGIGNYAYDWRENARTAESLTYQEAILRARDNRPDEPPQRIVDFDPQALNPTFTYYDDSGRLHEVWLLDAVTAANQWLMGVQMRLRGSALWLLGSEDPSIWNFLRRGRIYSPPDVNTLREITYPYDIEFVGDGEVLSVEQMPQTGYRRIEVDPSSGLCTDEEYTRFPSAFVIKRTGYHPKWLCITFDDGPSEYTEKVLEVLKRFGVHATFFVIGENAEHHPGILRKIWEQGHEIGSHTFTHPNMGAVSERRARLELNATQRAIQSILGRSTLLFRPPYNADAEPTSAEEVRPILLASQMGYLTIGEFIDPQDWNLQVRLPGGGVHRRTAQEIARQVIEQALAGTGNVILLHDGGGDRSQTVAALAIFIPYLQQRGYRFVTVSQLLGSARDSIMPPVSAKDMVLVGVDRVVFEVNNAIDLFLRVAFLSAIVLSLLRAISIVPLALASWLRERKRTPPPESYHPSVSVIIAAYNERKVIGRTVQAVLNSQYQPLEVIVVDDGSQDGTADEVERLFGHLPNVRVLRQTNQGKAVALNHALKYASGEVLVALDADTLFLPDTIGALVQAFADPRVGAVAGNVKVGNRVNVLTRWQAIEYITNQNMDRRAYALLNAVPVVPGAAGAWHREAVVQCGGYQSDTMAEDMDLTWRVRRAGWKIGTVNHAIALTEAPDTLKGLFRQRFRWAYGTLQCLWKHRDALGRYGWFGWLVLPSLWLFQVVFQVLSPLVDAQIAWTVANVGQAWLSRGLLRQDWQPLPQAMEALTQIGFLYALFFAVELMVSFVAFRLDRERTRLLWWLFWQRFVYRQMMYLVMVKSVLTAIQGARAGWSKLERRGSVRVPQ